MAALTCSGCRTHWPVDYQEFMPCPECGKHTWWMTGDTPIDRAAAISRARHAQFERYLDENGHRTVEELLEQAAQLDVPVYGD